MQDMGHGANYRHAHDEAEGYAAGERYFPEGMPDRHYYHPTERGLEQRIAERLRHFARLDARARREGQGPGKGK